MTTTDSARTADIPDVETGRARIDDIDSAIRDLVAERVEVSRTVQQLRKAGGRPGIQHARENEIIGRYVDAPGDAGADIALAVLALCRGRLPQSR
ncbi:MAG TPA: chorismate mutase [Mycobacteriales bacterium]